jgi:hypothetical protein
VEGDFIFSANLNFLGEGVDAAPENGIDDTQFES